MSETQDKITIYRYVKEQESGFLTNEVRIADNWHWNFRNHVQLIFHLKNGQFFTGENNWLRAFKNIMEPMLNLAYWTEQIQVKDVVFDIPGDNGRGMGFVLKKYHDEVFTKEHNLDKVFDEITQSDLDYGGVLLQETLGNPEVLDLNSIAFCDQTDLTGGPIGLKFYFSPDKLRLMSKKGWGDKKKGATITLNELATLAKSEKNLTGPHGFKSKTTGKNIEVYIVRGSLPEAWLKDNDNYDDYYAQVHVIAFYTNKDNKDEGCTLYRAKGDDDDFMTFSSMPIYQRALGRGEGEALLHPQIWTNFLTIHKMNMLEAASKIPLVTDDSSYSQKQKIQDMETLEITTIDEGKRIWQIPTAAPANVQLFEQAINDWQAHAQQLGSASDAMMGEQTSGTTFRGQNQLIQQGRGIHNKRRGTRAKFIEELYRKIWIPQMIKEIVSGKEFLATLSWEEMHWVSDKIATSYANKQVIEDILSGREPRDPEQLKKECIDEFHKHGNKHMFKVLKDEFKDVDILISVNVSNKQKDLIGMVDNLRSVFQTIAANPMVLKAPPMEKLFNRIVEASGLEPIDLTGLDVLQQPPQAAPGAQGAPQMPQVAMPPQPQPVVASKVK